MTAAQSNEDEQRALWNGAGGHAWVEAQDLLDRVLRPLENLLADAVLAHTRGAVLDVGCGTGGTTVAVARALGAAGAAPSDCTGVDISGPMIAAARARAEHEGVPARFVQADAQRHTFEPASVDAIMSRFGVMFFDDPVEAFANLGRAARPGAGLRCLTWRSAEQNPFMTTAERAAAPLLPDLPVREPSRPGQFALADAARFRRVLEDSGWTGIDIRPVDVDCGLPESELVRYLTLLGPVGRALRDADDRLRARVVETILPAFDSFVDGGEVRFTAACWLASAQPG